MLSIEESYEEEEANASSTETLFLGIMRQWQKRGIESEEDAMNENRREEEEEKQQVKIRQSIAKHESRAS